MYRRGFRLTSAETSIQQKGSPRPNVPSAESRAAAGAKTAARARQARRRPRAARRRRGAGGGTVTGPARATTTFPKLVAKLKSYRLVVYSDLRKYAQVFEPNREPKKGVLSRNSQHAHGLACDVGRLVYPILLVYIYIYR